MFQGLSQSYADQWSMLSDSSFLPLPCPSHEVTSAWCLDPVSWRSQLQIPGFHWEACLGPWSHRSCLSSKERVLTNSHDSFCVSHTTNSVFVLWDYARILTLQPCIEVVHASTPSLFRLSLCTRESWVLILSRPVFAGSRSTVEPLSNGHFRGVLYW